MKVLLSRREFLKACGLAGVTAAVVSLSTGCKQGEAGLAGTYTFSVVSGAILTYSDSKTGTYKYKKKCRVCGWESMFAKTVKGTSISEPYTCSRCKNKQTAAITVSKNGQEQPVAAV